MLPFLQVNLYASTVFVFEVSILLLLFNFCCLAMNLDLIDHGLFFKIFFFMSVSICFFLLHDLTICLAQIPQIQLTCCFWVIIHSCFCVPPMLDF